MENREKIKDCNTLDELFCLWRKEHKNESKESCCGEGDKIGTFPRKDGKSPDYDTFKDGFYPDGITSEAGNESSTNRCQVLFILKEPNVTKKITKGEDKYSFWFNEAVEESARKRYAKRFELILQRLIEKHGLKQEDSKLYGYMNLNKRGGYGTTDDKALAAYVKEYSCFIKKQISLLSPKYIVYCGKTFCKLLSKEEFKLVEDSSAEVFYTYHPSARKSLDDYINGLIPIN